MQSTNDHIILGAINLSTGLYTLPNEANKDTIYQCIGCKEDVFLKQGRIRSHHFCHYPTSQCTYYIHSSESEIHKNAKLRIKSILEQKHEISLLRECSTCHKYEQYDLPILSNTSNIELEYRFKIQLCQIVPYTTVEYIADVAYIDAGEPLCMIEVYHTHLTSSEHRVDPWFEVNAANVLQTKVEDGKIQLTCIRKENCDDCVEQPYKARYTKLCSSIIQSMTDSDLEFYVRYHLGHLISGYKHVYNPESNTYNRYINYVNPEHPNKLSYNEDDENNDRIINMFSDKIQGRVVIRGYKGSICMAILPKDDNKSYSYGALQSHAHSKEYISGEDSRTKIIMDILRLTNKHNVPIRRKNKHAIDDTADDLQDMRYAEQYRRACAVLDTSTIFDLKQIKYIEKNHVFTITHPLSNKTIRYTNKGKMFCNSKWISRITTKDIITWYKASIESSAGFEHMWSLK